MARHTHAATAPTTTTRFDLRPLLFIFTWMGMCFLASAQKQTMSEKLDQVMAVDEALRSNHIAYPAILPQINDRLPITFLRQIDREGEWLTQSDSATLITFKAIDMVLSRDSVATWLSRSLTIMEARIQDKLNFLDQLPNTNDPAISEASANNGRYPMSLDQSNQQFLQSMKERLGEGESDLATEIEAEKCWLSTLQLGLDQYVFENFIKAYAQSFDPHTSFFSIEDEGLLLAALSNEIYSSGLVLRRERLRLYVDEVMPFSDASSYEKIASGDEIVSVRIGTDWVSTRCLSISDLLVPFYGVDEDSLHVRLKSSEDETLRDFSLIKQFLQSSQNHIFRFLMKKGDLRIAYIRFPAFYSQVSRWGGSSAEDLAYDLLELKSKDLDGLVVDLRNNGGGSIGEAVDLSGFFIDAGPLFLTTAKEAPRGLLLKDAKRGMVFTGKVMYLTNSNTASASEMVVSAMQQYPNQLVVGSSTFGKSTGQRLVYLEKPGTEEVFGVLKVTRIKIYGMNGQSYQGVGVAPDIELPELSLFPVYEKDLSFYLENPPITKSFRPRMPRTLALDALRERSQNRIAGDSLFMAFGELKTDIDRIMTSGEFDAGEFRRKYKDFRLEVSRPVFEVQSMEDDPAFAAQSLKLEKKALTDPILNQVIQIFEDWINENQP